MLDEDISAICQDALREVAEDLASIQVSSCSGNWINGRLDFNGLPTEEVTFAVVEVKPGRSFVGDVDSGPDYFRRVSWRLKSVNGRSDFQPSWIARGDSIVLEGPRWVTERLHRSMGSAQNCSARSAGSTGVTTASAPPTKSREQSMHPNSSSGGLSASSSFIAALGQPPPYPHSSVVGILREGSRDDFDLVHAARSAPPPVVPKLDFAHLHKRRTGGSQKNQGDFLSNLCMALQPVQQDGNTTTSLGSCTSHWLGL